MFDQPVVFVDIETTGRSYRNSRILEIAAIRVENGEIINEFSTILDPETYIPPQITRLTGIEKNDTLDKPTFSNIADELFELCEGATFIAHNVRFDYSFLRNEFAMVGIDFKPRLLCTVRLSRRLYAPLKGHSLAKLIERHDIPVLDRHRALADAQAIWYFAQLAYDEHGHDTFHNAVAHQLKSQSLPPNLLAGQLDDIADVPGVYIFQDENHRPLYIGKSVTLRKRIMSHFSDGHSKEVKLSQLVHHIETIPTSSELAALLLESKLIKEQMPIHNRQLRRVTHYAMLIRVDKDSYASVHVASGAINESTDTGLIYGTYPTRTKAKHKLDEITRTFQLCPKLMGLESGKGACFSHSLGKCFGACIGVEPAEKYNLRFEIALERNKLHSWPYEGAVVIPINETGESVIIDSWTVQGYLTSEGEQVMSDETPTFDLDEYKILRRFLRENKSLIRPLT